MSAAPARPSKKPRDPIIYQKADKIKSQIDKLVTKMQKNNNYLPTRDEVEQYAIQINDLVVNNRQQVRQFESYLKAAIIDLTEVPDLHPTMQRIGFLTALKDASQKVQLFLDCC
jgi:O-methyltransferase involved in polyketide biosynthesis